MKPGKSWVYNEDIANEIFDRLSTGDSMRQICSDSRMPDRITVLRWMNKSEEFAAKCAHARDLQADLMDDRIIDVVNKLERGEMQPDVARVMLSGLQWRAAKLKPKKYGDSTILRGDKDNPIDIGLGQLLDAAASKRKELPAIDMEVSNVIDIEAIPHKLTADDLI